MSVPLLQNSRSESAIYVVDSQKAITLNKKVSFLISVASKASLDKERTYNVIFDT